jgi:RND family efflux transporter MFP subunit
MSNLVRQLKDAIMNISRLLLCLGFLLPVSAQSAELGDRQVDGSALQLTVQMVDIAEYKPVFATVESTDVTAARARIPGTLIDLKVDEGDIVEQGQIIATIGDDKLALQIESLTAQIAAAKSQQGKAKADYGRAQELFGNGTIAKAQLDAAKTLFDVADNQFRSVTAQRAVIDEQVREGHILAPVNGRVLDVPVTKGSVVMHGEVAARIAADGYILRLELPERYAELIKVGSEIRLDDGRVGVIRQVYPQIVQGRVRADAQAVDLDGFFVGQRIRVLVRAGGHQGFIVPLTYITTIDGIDYVTLKQENGRIDIPVQRGEKHAEGIEIISGLKAGDILLRKGE